MPHPFTETKQTIYVSVLWKVWYAVKISVRHPHNFFFIKFNFFKRPLRFCNTCIKRPPFCFCKVWQKWRFLVRFTKANTAHAQISFWFLSTSNRYLLRMYSIAFRSPLLLVPTYSTCLRLVSLWLTAVGSCNQLHNFRRIAAFTHLCHKVP